MEEMSWKFTPCLYLTPPAIESLNERSSSHANDHLHWLGRLEDVLRCVVGSEARVWLCSAIAALSVPSRVQSSVFMSRLKDAALSSRSQAKRQGAEYLLASSRKLCNNLVDTSGEIEDRGYLLGKQIVGMLCDGRPRQVGRLLANDYKLLRRFFSGDAKRILGWFQNFAGAGETDHRLGARALARYAFLHREDYWHELEWKGKHSQAPATVASKPYYFSELDVLRTVENFLQHVPSFWTSEELRDSLEEGEFLSLDSDFFHNELHERLISDNCDELWLLIEDYVRTESFSVLCQRTLYLMSDKSLLAFLANLGASLRKFRKDVMSRREQGDMEVVKEDCSGGNSFKDIPWLEMVYSAGVEWETLYDAAFSNACANHGREVLKLLQDEEHVEEARTLSSLLSEGFLCKTEHWRLKQECLQAEKWEAVKWLSMEAWLLFYLFSQESTSAESLERLMTEVGTGFVRTKPTSFEVYDSIRTSKESKRGEKRKRRRSRRRARERARREDDESEDDSDHISGPSKENNHSALNWRLSLDNYTIPWTKVDVAENLVSYAIRQWLQWVTRRW